MLLTAHKRLKQVFLILLLTVGIFLAIWFIVQTRRPGDFAPGISKQTTPLSAEKESIITIGGSWPMFHGNQSLTGLAGGDISPPLKLLWKFPTKGPIKSSAVIGNGRVFIGSSDGKVYALDQRSGREIWNFTTGDAVEAAGCLLADTLYIGSLDNNFYALDAAAGKLLWKFSTQGKIAGAANWFLPQKAGPAAIIFGSFDNSLYCLDSRTGKLIWRYESENYINGSPAVSPEEHLAVFGGCDAAVHLIDLGTGRQVRQIDTGDYIAASVVLSADRVFVGNFGGLFLAADINTGQTLWQLGPQDQPFFSSAALADGVVVVGSRDKRLYCLDQATGQPRWTFQTQGEVDSSPVICSDKVVFGSGDGRIYIVSLTTGKELWSYEIGESITASPAVADGMLIIGSDDGCLYAFIPQ